MAEILCVERHGMVVLYVNANMSCKGKRNEISKNNNTISTGQYYQPEFIPAESTPDAAELATAS